MTKRDRTAALIFFALGLGIIFYSLQNLELGTMKLPGSGFFPAISGACAVIFSLAWLFSARSRGARANESRPLWEKGDWIRPLMVVAITAGYAAVIDFLGFVLTTFLFIVIWQFLIVREKWIKILIISLIGTASMYVMFQLLLKIPLPKSTFTF
jgi:putative tricarboxylic transport membrane protein